MKVLITLPDILLAQLDEVRGLRGRSAEVERRLEASLRADADGEPVPAPPPPASGDVWSRVSADTREFIEARAPLASPPTDAAGWIDRFVHRWRAEQYAKNAAKQEAADAAAVHAGQLVPFGDDVQRQPLQTSKGKPAEPKAGKR